jgi:hypothetical protein
MRDAFAKTAEKRNAATTALPAPGDQTAKGPIPFDVVQTSLKNARAKERADVQAEYEAERKQYEWAKQIPQETLQKAIEFATLMGDNPVEFADRFVKDLVSNPKYKDDLISRATRNRDAQGRYVSGSTTPQIDLNPYRVQMSDGKEIGLYTAEQMAAREAMLEQQWMAKVEARFGPIEKMAQTQQAERQAAIDHAEGERMGTSVYQTAKSWAGMDSKETQVAVAKEVERLAPNPNDPRDVVIALHEAYHRVVGPTLLNQGSAHAKATFMQKAVAATESPSQTAPTPQTRPKNPHELAKFMAAKSASRNRV